MTKALFLSDIECAGQHSSGMLINLFVKSDDSFSPPPSTRQVENCRILPVKERIILCCIYVDMSPQMQQLCSLSPPRSKELSTLILDQLFVRLSF